MHTILFLMAQLNSFCTRDAILIHKSGMWRHVRRDTGNGVRTDEQDAVMKLRSRRNGRRWRVKYKFHGKIKF